jgi:iron complex outermembrane receptor protein
MHLKLFACLLSLIFSLASFGQDESIIRLKVIDSLQQPIANATVALKLKKDSSVIKVQLTDTAGSSSFTGLTAGDYFFRVTHLGFNNHSGSHFFIPENYKGTMTAVLAKAPSSTLSNITVSTRKAFIEMKPGKTIVNLDAGISTAGTTAIEALEKMPGITVDKDGNISLKGRTGVSVLIDGKQTYLDPSQISTLLNGMSASQISTVEIIEQPSSKYDAAGNAGIINIRLKKNNQKGFNGNVSTSFAQGVYPKNNNNLQMNFRNGRFNLFLNYSVNISRNFTKIYALRRYYNSNGDLTSMLEQLSDFKGKGNTHNLRTGVDYAINEKASAGIIVSGLALQRKGNTDNPAEWLDGNMNTDSLIQTYSKSNTHWKNRGINFNFRHAFTAEKEISFDVDRISYRIRGNQYFENNGITPVNYKEATRAGLPSDINITSAKADYAMQVKEWKIEAGAKTSHINTNNLAAYELLDGTMWREDNGKSNHFLYTENIHALYANAESKTNQWAVHGGLRYEMTNYDAHQLGNSIVKDSSFSRSYNSLFPSALLNYQMDSSNQFSLSAGRRIDRPAFQKLNPFVFIINKYTYQTGNPFFLPQYTWNIEVSHLYKDVVATSLSYSITKDYFSQIFPVSNNGIIIYTEGNLQRLQTLGASVSLQLSMAKWWSVSMQVDIIHKKMRGFIERQYEERVTQGSLSFNNQLRFQKGWSGEVSGFYTSKSRNDIQEVVDPAGQVSVGIAKTVLKNKATIKLAARDIFYTQWMKGNTQFTNATEYFKLTRDSRVVNVSFNYRFGKSFKTIKRGQGAAKEEIERVDNG